MSFSIRLDEKERQLANNYAKLYGISVGQAFKNALFEKIEDEYDIQIADKAYSEYLKNPISYSHEEVKDILGL